MTTEVRAYKLGGPHSNFTVWVTLCDQHLGKRLIGGVSILDKRVGWGACSDCEGDKAKGRKR